MNVDILNERARLGSSELDDTEKPTNAVPSPTSNARKNTACTMPASVSSDGLKSTSSSNSMVSEEDDDNSSATPTNSWVSASATKKPEGFSARWTRTVKILHEPIIKFLQIISSFSARNPKKTIVFVTFLSIFLLWIGYSTNFYLEIDEGVLWTPADSYPRQHSNWIHHGAGGSGSGSGSSKGSATFKGEDKYFILFFHSNGDDVLGKDQVSRIFEAVDAVRNMDGYDDICKESNSNATTTDGVPTCKIDGVVRFWNSSTSVFQDTVKSDADAIADMSARKYADGSPFAENRVFGYPERDPGTGILTKAQSYTILFSLPRTPLTDAFEMDAVDVIVAMDDQWAAAGASLRVEVRANGSFASEFIRAISNDLLLVPVVFILMSVFTCCVFARRSKVYSRSLLGFAAVTCCLFSIMTGYGILFMAGIPFTTMTSLLPFIFFGIGLDDAFIVYGSYGRTDPTKDAVERIAETVNDVGLSITLTTLTSATAFGLGCLSSIPAVNWMCLYSFPTIIIVLLYQLTFFVACIVVDEHRIKDGRMDCCICVKPKDFDPTQSFETQNPKEQAMDRFMVLYAKILLKPAVKVMVVLAFTALTCLAGWSASQLTQSFQITDILPADSYITDFVEAGDKYTAATSIYIGVYFRYVNQLDPSIQAQMIDYLADLVAMDSVAVPPDYFWVPNFQKFVNTTGIGDEAERDQIYYFMEYPLFKELYSDHIVLDSVGNISYSRTYIYMSNVDLGDVKQQIDALEEQRAVTLAQPINQGREDDLPFFTYAYQYNLWEFFRVTPKELVLTTIVAVAAVTGITILLVPHWTAVFFIFPLICVLYIDLMGVLQWAGLYINAVSYVCLAMSIGLLVDFVMHILLRYYETAGNRREKTIDMLRTMGASVLVGGISTFLGTLPLLFSTSTIFNTVFIAFLGIVTLGVSHGLILLPVLLSTFGPEDQVSMSFSPSAGQR